MKRIFVPTRSADDWKRLLAKPDLHWRAGASAMSTARSWEAADGLPPEIAAALNSGPEELQGLQLVIAVPEWEVELPGGPTSSHTDVLAVATNGHGLVVIAVEAKVDEPFGPTLGEKRVGASAGLRGRLAHLHETLGLTEPLPDSIRYQLLHRAASALLTAGRFHAGAAVMLVQSFSEEGRWFDDFTAFAAAMQAPAKTGTVARAGDSTRPPLYLGWCVGDQRFRQPIAREPNL